MLAKKFGKKFVWHKGKDENRDWILNRKISKTKIDIEIKNDFWVVESKPFRQWLIFPKKIAYPNLCIERNRWISLCSRWRQWVFHCSHPTFLAFVRPCSALSLIHRWNYGYSREKTWKTYRLAKSIFLMGRSLLWSLISRGFLERMSYRRTWIFHSFGVFYANCP